MHILMLCALEVWALPSGEARPLFIEHYAPTANVAIV